MSGLFSCFSVKINQWTEAMCFTADNGNHQRQAKYTGTNERFGCTSHAQPNRKWLLYRSWIYPLPFKCRTEFARPMNKLMFHNIKQQIEFFFKYLVIILQIETE